MLVKDRMSSPAITVNADLSMHEALNLMRTKRVRRFPVVDRHNHLVGIVSERDLLHAAPSDVTTLSVWEVHYLLSKITVEKLMTRNVITVTEDTPLEEAARIMADQKIGGVPVVRNSTVVGIITETDLFKVFLELLGARDPGIRLSARVPDVPGELAKLTQAVFAAGGNIVALGTFLGESTSERQVLVKVDGLTADKLQAALEPLVTRIVDVRESKAVA